MPISVNINKAFRTNHKVKMDLFLRYGYIAAAGDRHLAEACPSKWYLESPESVYDWGYGLTTIDHRYTRLNDRMEKSKKLLSGELKFEIEPSGEEGVKQMKAIAGLGDFVTNVNLPNIGQVSNLPMGAVVETNASFTAGQVNHVCTGNMPANIHQLTMDHVLIQEMVVEAVAKKDLNMAFEAFLKDPQVATLSVADAKALFDEMVENTKEYLKMYF